MEPHRSTLPQVMRQRSVELAQAASAHEVTALMARWECEDAEAPRREQLLEQSVVQLEGALHALEAKVAAMPAAIGRALGGMRKDLAESLGARLDAVEARSAVRYRGIWASDQTYDAHDLVTCRGGGWIAQAGMAPGVRPGSESAWRLCIKSDTSELAKLVRAEVVRQLGGKPGKAEKG